MAILTQVMIRKVKPLIKINISRTHKAIAMKLEISYCNANKTINKYFTSKNMFKPKFNILSQDTSNEYLIAENSMKTPTFVVTLGVSWLHLSDCMQKELLYRTTEETKEDGLGRRHPRAL